MATLTPDRALEQRRAALAKANDIRQRRAVMKRRVKEQPYVLAVYVRRTPWWLEDVQVRVMMAKIPYLGQGRVIGGGQGVINMALAAAGCDRLATFGSLKRLQREKLAAEVERLTAKFRPRDSA